MDINMPVMDGVKATSILKEKMRICEIPYTPIVAVSAARCESQQDLEQYYSVGFDHFSKLVVLIFS